MTRIFDTSRIKENDSLRERKVNDLNTIKNYLQAIDKDIKLEALEKGL